MDKRTGGRGFLEGYWVERGGSCLEEGEAGEGSVTDALVGTEERDKEGGRERERELYYMQ